MKKITCHFRSHLAIALNPGFPFIMVSILELSQLFCLNWFLIMKRYAGRVKKSKLFVNHPLLVSSS